MNRQFFTESSSSSSSKSVDDLVSTLLNIFPFVIDASVNKLARLSLEIILFFQFDICVQGMSLPQDKFVC